MFLHVSVPLHYFQGAYILFAKVIKHSYKIFKIFSYKIFYNFSKHNV